MKKNHWLVWILFTLPFLIWYFACVDSISTAIENGNTGDFILMWLILGASSVVHYFALCLINSKLIKKEVKTLNFFGWLKESGALYVLGGIVVAIVLALVTAVICIFVHLFITLLMLFKQKDLEDDYSSYKYTPPPKTAPKTQPRTTNTTTTRKTQTNNTTTRTTTSTQKPKLNPKFSEYGLKSAIKRETGNGNDFVISCRYCKRTYMSNFDVNVFNASDEIKVTFKGVIKIVLDKQELMENVTCQHDLDVKMDQVADSASRGRQSTVRSLFVHGQAGISAYEREIGGWYGKKVMMYEDIDVEEA